MVWWIPLAIAGAQAAGRLSSKSRRSKNHQKEVNAIKEAGGYAAYDPNMQRTLEQMDPEATGPAGYYRELLANHQGGWAEMQEALKRNAAFVPSTLTGTQGYQDINNYRDTVEGLPQEKDIMAAAGAQIGKMARSAGHSYQRSKGMMQRSGLGNSAAMAALANQHSQGMAGQSADLFSKMYQASMSQRMTNAQLQQQWAGRAYDVNRDIAAMSLGASPAPREPAQKTNLWGQVAQTAGSAIGTYLAGQYGGQSAGMGSQFGQGSQMDQMQQYGGY